MRLTKNENIDILNESYNKATIPPMLLSLVLGIGLGFLNPLLFPNIRFGGNFDYLGVVPFFASAFISVTSLTMFLCRFKGVRDNSICLALVWFFFPITIICRILYESFMEFRLPITQFGTLELAMIGVCLLHLILLFRTFYNYKKSIRLKL